MLGKDVFERLYLDLQSSIRGEGPYSFEALKKAGSASLVQDLQENVSAGQVPNHMRTFVETTWPGILRAFKRINPQG